MKIIMMCLFLLYSGRLCAQQFWQRTEFIEVGGFVHSFGVPFLGNDFFKFDHLPGLSLGTRIPWKSQGRWQTDYRLRLSGYLAEGLHRGLHLENSVVRSYEAADWLKLEGEAGLGYLHTFEEAALYRMGTNGYTRQRDWGHPQITISIGLGFAFRFNRDSPYWVAARQQFLIQLPFASKSGVPLLMHNRTYLGLRREINLKFRRP